MMSNSTSGAMYRTTKTSTSKTPLKPSNGQEFIFKHDKNNDDENNGNNRSKKGMSSSIRRLQEELKLCSQQNTEIMRLRTTLRQRKFPPTPVSYNGNDDYEMLSENSASSDDEKYSNFSDEMNDIECSDSDGDDSEFEMDATSEPKSKTNSTIVAPLAHYPPQLQTLQMAGPQIYVTTTNNQTMHKIKLENPASGPVTNEQILEIRSRFKAIAASVVQRRATGNLQNKKQQNGTTDTQCNTLQLNSLANIEQLRINGELCRFEHSQNDMSQVSLGLGPEPHVDSLTNVEPLRLNGTQNGNVECTQADFPPFASFMQEPHVNSQTNVEALHIKGTQSIDEPALSSIASPTNISPVSASIGQPVALKLGKLPPHFKAAVISAIAQLKQQQTGLNAHESGTQKQLNTVTNYHAHTEVNKQSKTPDFTVHESGTQKQLNTVTNYHAHTEVKTQSKTSDLSAHGSDTEKRQETDDNDEVYINGNTKNKTSDFIAHESGTQDVEDVVMEGCDDPDPIICHYCNKDLILPRKLVKHLATKHRHIGGMFKCSYCGDGFFAKDKYSEHLVLHGEKSQPCCKFCKKSFESVDLLIEHIPIHDHKKQKHQQTKLNGNGSGCIDESELSEDGSLCNCEQKQRRKDLSDSQDDDNKALLTNQNASHSFRNSKTKDGADDTKDKEPTEQHENPNDDSYLLQSKLNENIIVDTCNHKNLQPKDGTRFDVQEKQVKRVCPTEYSKDQQRKQVGNEADNSPSSNDQQQDNNEANSTRKRKECPHCSQSFQHYFAWLLHMKTHDETKIFTCQICNKWHLTIRQLSDHVVTHMRVKRPKCEICFLSFRNKQDIKAHNKIDCRTLTFQCERRKCYEVFFNWKDYNEHLLTRHIDEIGTCKFCGLYVGRRYDKLKTHLLIHTGDKPHTCKICGNKFTTPWRLRIHMHTHAETKTYKCNECDKAFKQPAALYRHKRTHNKCLKYEHHCHICQKSFTQSCSLQRHLRIHTGERFKCSHCTQTFIEVWRMREHIKKNHKL